MKEMGLLINKTEAVNPCRRNCCCFSLANDAVHILAVHNNFLHICIFTINSNLQKNALIAIWTALDIFTRDLKDWVL